MGPIAEHGHRAGLIVDSPLRVCNQSHGAIKQGLHRGRVQDRFQCTVPAAFKLPDDVVQGLGFEPRLLGSEPSGLPLTEP